MLQSSLTNIKLCSVRHRKSSATHGLLLSKMEAHFNSVVQSQFHMVEKQNKMLDIIQPALLLSRESKSPAFKVEQLHDDPLASSMKSLRTPTSQRLRNGTLRCYDDCNCRCHHKAITRTPICINESLGSFYIHHQDRPWYHFGAVECDNQSCRRSRRYLTVLKYFLPRWFAGIIANLNISINFRPFPLNLSIISRNVVSYESRIFVLARNDDVEGVRMLLRNGEASINDVDPSGNGVLDVSH